MLQFHYVSFTYPSAPGSLFTSLSLTFGKGWSGLVGPNGSGKTTLIGLAAGELQPYRDAILTKKLASMAFFRFGHDWEAFLARAGADLIPALRAVFAEP